jgi:hypothetical protein
MTVKECTAILGPVALAMRAPMDEPSFRAYARVLKDIAPALLELALDDVLKGGAQFMPSAPELLTACELTRRRLLALHPYDGCAECEDQRGYRTVLNATGQKTVEKCPCKARHLERLAGMGLADPVAALPGEVTRESEQIYPTANQLPAHIRQQLNGIAGQKALR